MTGVDATSARRFDNSLPYTQEQSAKALLRREMERAGLSPSYEAPSFFHIDENLWLAMTTHSYGVNPLDPASLTEAVITARRELFAQEQALRALGQPWEKLRIAATALRTTVRAALDSIPAIELMPLIMPRIRSLPRLYPVLPFKLSRIAFTTAFPAFRTDSAALPCMA